MLRNIVLLQCLQKMMCQLSQALLEIGVNINVNLENAQQCYELLNQNITTLKSQRKLAQNYQAKFTSTFIPPNGDYQNYGIMAALDHINALKDLVKRFPKLADLPKIMGVLWRIPIFTHSKNSSLVCGWCD